MKNKFVFFITVCLFVIINCYNIKAEEFVFESSVIEISGDGNIIQAIDGVKVSTKNNIEITAKEFTYDKIKLVLSLIGNIKVNDRENNIIIEGENVIYYKNIEKIISKGNTIIHIDNEYVINASDIIYSKKENIIRSKNLATLEDNFENKFSAEDFTFLVLDKIFKSKTINLLDSEKNNYNFNESMVNIKTNEIIGKDVKIDFRNDIFGNSENDPRLKGNYASSNKEETIIKSGIFTTCKKNNKCPPWTLKSAEIQHDKKNKIIN